MNGNRVVDGGTYATGGQMGAEGIPFIGLHDKSVIDAYFPRSIHRTTQVGTVGQSPAILFREFSAACIDSCQARKFDSENCGLDGVEPRHHAKFDTFLAAWLAVSAEQPGPLGNLFV